MSGNSPPQMKRFSMCGLDLSEWWATADISMQDADQARQRGSYEVMTK